MQSNNSESNSLTGWPEDGGWILRLYVTMQSVKSIKACINIEELCKAEINGNFQIELINLLKNPKLSSTHQICPTDRFINKLPASIREIIEDLSNNDRVLVGIDLVNN